VTSQGVGMSRSSHFQYFKISFEIMRLAVTRHVGFPLSLSNVKGLLLERGVEAQRQAIDRSATSRSAEVFTRFTEIDRPL
jgi:transposase-like protein